MGAKQKIVTFLGYVINWLQYGMNGPVIEEKWEGIYRCHDGHRWLRGREYWWMMDVSEMGWLMHICELSMGHLVEGPNRIDESVFGLTILICCLFCRGHPHFYYTYNLLDEQYSFCCCSFLFFPLSPFLLFLAFFLFSFFFFYCFDLLTKPPLLSASLIFSLSARYWPSDTHLLWTKQKKKKTDDNNVVFGLTIRNINLYNFLLCS